MKYRVALFVALTGISAIALAQEKSPLEDRSTAASVSRRINLRPAASLRLDVNRVLIPVTVTDAEDHKIAGLRKADFRLFEDGAPRDVVDFFVDDSPVSVGIVLDSSNSMRNKFDNARRAIAEFMRMSLPEDEFFLVSVKDQPELAHGFTRDSKSMLHEIEAIQPRGWTALYDGMYLAINHFKHANHDRRVLLVLSDGGDNNSRYTESEIKNLMRESDVRIFTISILEHSPVIERLAEQSGGRAFRARNLQELPDKAIALSGLVHGEYVLGFTPANQKWDGKHHTIKVELVQPPAGAKLHASWRHSYASPLE
jgi:Ca-activated chloride channel homolog